MGMRSALLLMLPLLIAWIPLLGSMYAVISVQEGVEITIDEDGGFSVQLWVIGLYPDVDFGIDPGDSSLSNGVAQLIVGSIREEANTLVIAYNSSLPHEQLKSMADQVAQSFSEAFNGMYVESVTDGFVPPTHIFYYTVAVNTSVALAKFVECAPKQSVKKLLTPSFIKKCFEFSFMFYVDYTGVVTVRFEGHVLGYFKGVGEHRLDFKELFGFHWSLPHGPQTGICIDAPPGATITNVECDPASYYVNGGIVTITIIGPQNVPNIVVHFTYTFPEDNNPPNVLITSPSAGSNVSGSVTITADVDDDSGILWVAFLVDDTLIANLTFPPWQCIWDTMEFSDGLHTITVEACDAYRNISSDSVQVYVNNAGGGEEETPSPDILSEFPVNLWIALIVSIVIVVALIAVIAFVLVRRISAKGEYALYPPPPPSSPSGHSSK